MFKKIAALAIALGIFVVQALPAFACGGLVAPNGAVRLGRATTLVAWHNGIEHYLTTFTYQENNTNSGANLGWIVPLPAVPLKIAPPLSPALLEEKLLLSIFNVAIPVPMPLAMAPPTAVVLLPLRRVCRQGVEDAGARRGIRLADGQRQSEG